MKWLNYIQVDFTSPVIKIYGSGMWLILAATNFPSDWTIQAPSFKHIMNEN